MLQFTVYHNDELIKTYEFEDSTITIGRLPENDIPIASISISRRHVRIEKDSTHQFLLSDLNSLNGTFVNNKKITKTSISDGDKITIGKYTINIGISSGSDSSAEDNSKDNKSEENGVVDLENIQKEEPDTIDIDENTGDKELKDDEQNENGKKSKILLIETNKHVIYKIDKPIMSIGSSESDDIFVEGFLITDEHVIIEKKDDGMWIHANKLMGRFKINGKKENKHKLQHKDRIEIGTSTFRYMVNGQT
ncbi:MAG: FHA domain-containing protein [Chitinispirillia bacterium]|jgi:pSer/pThr/pTyr-binding forkhead associated (FHA) protein